MRQQIGQLVSQLTGNANMFTAFDITMMLRRANPTTNIRHGEVRDIVHDLFTSGDSCFVGYVRNPHKVDLNKPEALVYHPFTLLVEDYDPNFLSVNTGALSAPLPPLQAPTQQAASQPLQTTTTTSPIGNRPKRSRYDLDNVPVDKFGRVRIPASVLRASGFAPKDSVRVVLDPNLVVVTSSTDVYGKSAGKKYVVDQYNNIRVKVGTKYPGKSVFKMQPATGKVFATPV